jgi:hypothetical protein
MAWRCIGSGQYYYLSCREGRTVRSVYQPGEAGRAWAAVLAGRRRLRAAERQALATSRKWGREQEAALGPLLKATAELAGLLLIGAGFVRHTRGRWMRRRIVSRDVTVPAPQDLGELLARAAKGDLGVYDEVMAVLDDPERGPRLVAGLYNVADIAKARLVKSVAGPDFAMERSMLEWLDTVSHKVAGEHPTPLERILSEQVAVCLFASWRCQIRTAQVDHMTMAQAMHETKLLDRAHRRLMQAVATLATIRRVAAPLVAAQINVNVPP